MYGVDFSLFISLFMAVCIKGVPYVSLLSKDADRSV